MRTFLSLSAVSLAEIQLTPNSQPMIAVSTSDSDTQTAGLVGDSTESLVLTGQVEVASAGSWVNLTRVNLPSAAVGAITLRRQGTKAGGTLTFASQPANNETVIIGLVGFTRTYTFKTTLSVGPAVVNEVLRGADKFESARNLANAINDDTGEGTRYATGTTINEYLSAYADAGYSDTTLNGTSEATIYIRDKLACNRRLGWSITGTAIGGSITKVDPVGGISGDLIAELAPGQTGAGDTVTLNSTDETNVDSGSTPTYDTIQTSGRQSRLYIQNEGPGDLLATIMGGPDVDHLVEQTTVQADFDTGVVYESATIGPCEVVRVSFSSVTGNAAVYAALVY